MLTRLDFGPYADAIARGCIRRLVELPSEHTLPGQFDLARKFTLGPAALAATDGNAVA
jgi:hypothetical protein